MKFKTFLAVGCWLIAYSFVNGQSISIDTCYQMAKDNYPKIKQFGLIEQSEKFNLSNANKAYLPQFSLNAQATYQSDVTEIPPDFLDKLGQMIGQNLAIPSVNRDQYKVVAELSQVVWDGGVTYSQKDNIKASSEVEKQSLEVDLYAIRDRVNQLFFGILLLNEQMIQLDILQDELQTNYDKVQAFIQNGIANQTDADMIKVEQLKTKQRKAELSAAQMSYKRMLSAMTGNSIVLTGTLQKPDDLMFHSDNTSNNRPELKLFEAQTHLLGSQESLLKSSNLPKVGLFAQGGYGNPGLNMFEPGFTPFYIVGARLSWNFGGLYTQKNNLNKIAVGKQQVEIQKETFLFNVNLKVLQQKTEIEKIKEQINSDNEIVTLRTGIKKSVEKRLENGTSTVTDLVREMNAESAAIAEKSLHEIQLLMAIYNLKNSTNN
jgi:outer membrane protein TolC